MDRFPPRRSPRILRTGRLPADVQLSTDQVTWARPTDLEAFSGLLQADAIRCLGRGTASGIAALGGRARREGAASGARARAERAGLARTPARGGHQRAAPARCRSPSGGRGWCWPAWWPCSSDCSWRWRGGLALAAPPQIKLLEMKHITSRDNPDYRRLLRLTQSAAERRETGLAVLDGIHLDSGVPRGVRERGDGVVRRRIGGRQPRDPVPDWQMHGPDDPLVRSPVRCSCIGREPDRRSGRRACCHAFGDESPGDGLLVLSMVYRILATSARSSEARRRPEPRRRGCRRAAPIPGHRNASEAGWERSSGCRSAAGWICRRLLTAFAIACWSQTAVPVNRSTQPTCRARWPSRSARKARACRRSCSPARMDDSGFPCERGAGVVECGCRRGSGLLRVEETPELECIWPRQAGPLIIYIIHIMRNIQDGMVGPGQAAACSKRATWVPW